MRTGTNLRTQAHIRSLNGEMQEIVIVGQVGDNDYIAEYNGQRYHAIFNWFRCEYYVDDYWKAE